MATLSDTQIANIIFNETRSLSGGSIAQARVNVAHAIINALASPHKLPPMALTTAKVPAAETAIMLACTQAVQTARANIAVRNDPTKGATHFNFRKNTFSGAFQGHALKTSVGPLTNSYPTTELPANGIYANTYD